MKLQESIRGVLVRDLRALRRELEAYGKETDIWELPAGISNSAGTLALHLVGNLQSFIGAALGESGYVRDRQAEFSRRDVSLAELIREIERTIVIVDATLNSLASKRLSEACPVAFGAIRVSTGDFLIHLSTHLAFHLGQIDYHRRLVTGDNQSIGPQAIPDLVSATTTD